MVLQKFLRPFEVAFNGALAEQILLRNEGTSSSHDSGAYSWVGMGAVQENTSDNNS